MIWGASLGISSYYVMFNNWTILTVSSVTWHREKSLSLPIPQAAGLKWRTTQTIRTYLLKEKCKTQGQKDPRFPKKCFSSLHLFSECSYGFKSPEQFSKANVILQQTGRQFYWKVNTSLHIQITGSITKTVLSPYKLQFCGARRKATDSRGKCCESTSASFCLQSETLPQPHHWAHVCWEIPALLCKTKLSICTNLRPTAASYPQKLKTESP